MFQNLLKKTKAILFDFDGVLVDSEPLYYASYNKSFEKRGHSIKDVEYWEYWSSKGEGIAGEALRYDIELSEEEMKVMYAERCEYYSEFCRNGAVPFYPGMLDALLLLKERGLAFAVASSSFENDIHCIFEKAGASPPPCPIVGRGAGLRPKPHPDLFVYAAGVLQVAPRDCMVIEDAHKGLEAAKAVDMTCVILKNQLNRNLDYPGADVVVENHVDFLAALQDYAGKQ
ncbi:MAG: HAD family phosphatase [Planctomycetota bacterium]